MLQVNTPHKSTRSNGSGNCVETTLQSDRSVTVEDTKDRGPAFAVSGIAFEAFTNAVRSGTIS